MLVYLILSVISFYDKISVVVSMAGAFVFQKGGSPVNLEDVSKFVASFKKGALLERQEYLDGLLAQIEAIRKKEEGSLTIELAKSVRALITPRAFKLIGELKLLNYLDQVISSDEVDPEAVSPSGIGLRELRLG